MFIEAAGHGKFTYLMFIEATFHRIVDCLMPAVGRPQLHFQHFQLCTSLCSSRRCVEAPSVGADRISRDVHPVCAATMRGKSL